MPYNIDLYAVDFEGRKHQITNDLQKGYGRKEATSLSIPWVFKNSSDGKRLHVFVGASNGSIFKGKQFFATENSSIHVTVNENGELFQDPVPE